MEKEEVSIDVLLNIHFAGRVVRKDLTKLLKEGANVPVYVLEYLLGMYCAVEDEDVIQEGLKTVKQILSDNYVRPDEAEKVKSKIKEIGSYKIIDKVTVKLNEKRDVYEAILSNLGVKGLEVSSDIVKRYEKLLVGGIWCILNLQYYYEEGSKDSPRIKVFKSGLKKATAFFNTFFIPGSAAAWEPQSQRLRRYVTFAFQCYFDHNSWKAAGVRLFLLEALSS